MQYAWSLRLPLPDALRRTDGAQEGTVRDRCTRPRRVMPDNPPPTAHRDPSGYMHQAGFRALKQSDEQSDRHDTFPKEFLLQWLKSRSALHHRCGGSVGLSPTSQLFGASATHRHLTREKCTEVWASIPAGTAIDTRDRARRRIHRDPAPAGKVYGKRSSYLKDTSQWKVS
jgi:hypothetical protein